MLADKKLVKCTKGVRQFLPDGRSFVLRIDSLEGLAIDIFKDLGGDLRERNKILFRLLQHISNMTDHGANPGADGTHPQLLFPSLPREQILGELKDQARCRGSVRRLVLEQFIKQFPCTPQILLAKN